MARDLEGGKRPLAFESFEVEQPQLAPRHTLREPRSGPWGLFPYEPFKWCPSSVYAFIPRQWTKFQGWTHVLLVMGTFACAGLLVDGVISLKDRLNHSNHSQEVGIDRVIGYARDMVALIFIFPCLCYFVKTVEQFDETLHNKKIAIESQRQSLIGTYLDTLGDMDNILAHATETNAGFAERSFETKRRDFLRFLERTHTRFLTRTEETAAIEEQFFQQFRRFCFLWFQAFAECSIDPAGDPKTVVSEAELNQCLTILEVCTVCKERLRVREVKFLSNQQTRDAQEIIERRDRMQHQKSSDTLLRPSWVRFGCYCHLCRDICKDGFPKDIELIFFCVTLLSKEHVLLICGWFLGLILFPLEVYLPYTMKRVLALIILNEFCLGMTLCQFESIDIIQQLEKQSRKLEEEREAVRIKHEQMDEFWGKAQRNIDLWLHRTVPRLDLFSEVHAHIEDASGQQALKGLVGANKMFQELQDNLGPVEAWSRGGLLNDGEMKKFETAVFDLTQEKNLASILDKFVMLRTSLNEIHESSMRRSGNTAGGAPLVRISQWTASDAKHYRP